MVWPVPGACSAAAPPAVRPLRWGCSWPGRLCLRAVPKCNGEKNYQTDLTDLSSKQPSSGQGTGRVPAARLDSSPGSGAARPPPHHRSDGHGRGRREQLWEAEGVGEGATGSAPLCFCSTVAARMWRGCGGRVGAAPLPLPHLPLCAPGARTARLLSERCPGGCGGAEGRELNRERKLRKKEVAREGINSIQLANGAGASPPRWVPAHRQRLRALRGASPEPEPPCRQRTPRLSRTAAARPGAGPLPAARGAPDASPHPGPACLGASRPNDIASIGEGPGGAGGGRGATALLNYVALITKKSLSFLLFARCEARRRAEPAPVPEGSRCCGPGGAGDWGGGHREPGTRLRCGTAAAGIDLSMGGRCAIAIITLNETLPDAVASSLVCSSPPRHRSPPHPRSAPSGAARLHAPCPSLPIRLQLRAFPYPSLPGSRPPCPPLSGSGAPCSDLAPRLRPPWLISAGLQTALSIPAQLRVPLPA